jgi:hypothetical protein
MVTDVYIGLAVTSHSDGDICTAEIDNVAFSTVTYEGYTAAKADSDTTSITISTIGTVVSTIGSWVNGLTHAAEAGSNRVLIFIAHVEDNDGAINLASVTYGGQSMTKVINITSGTSGNREYVVAYVLDEAGITAATSGSFAVNWGSNSPDRVQYYSVFLQNVNQTAPIGATAGSATLTGATITTSALATGVGDLVIDAATCGNTGNYTVNNNFTEAYELGVAGFDGVAGYKSATGVDETPSVTHSTTTSLQALIGFVVQVNEESGIEGDLLIAAIATDGDTSSSLAPPSGENWNEIDVDDYGGVVTLGAWWKFADASESASHEFTWSGGQQAYGWMMHFKGHNANNPINDYSTYGQSSISPNSPTVTTTIDNCLILRLGAFDNDDIYVDIPGLPSHTPITMDKSITSNYTVEILGSWVNGLTHAAEAGSNRVLIFIAHVEDNDGAINLASVTYGGQSMTKVINITSGTSGNREYVVAYVLDEAGITAATSGSFTVNWGTNPPDRVQYYSVFLQNVNQTTPIGATASSATLTGATITTSALATSIGDLVIDAATCGNTGTYTVDNDFTEVYDLGVANFDGVAGYKSATGADETPSVTHSTTTSLQALIGFVVQHFVINGTVSGGAGYIGQASSGDSGTSTFTLTSSNASQMLTIAIAPADVGSCEGTIQP